MHCTSQDLASPPLIFKCPGHSYTHTQAALFPTHFFPQVWQPRLEGLPAQLHHPKSLTYIPTYLIISIYIPRCITLEMPPVSAPPLLDQVEFNRPRYLTIHATKKPSGTPRSGWAVQFRPSNQDVGVPSLLPSAVGHISIITITIRQKLCSRRQQGVLSLNFVFFRRRRFLVSSCCSVQRFRWCLHSSSWGVPT